MHRYLRVWRENSIITRACVRVYVPAQRAVLRAALGSIARKLFLSGILRGREGEREKEIECSAEAGRSVSLLVPRRFTASANYLRSRFSHAPDDAERDDDWPADGETTACVEVGSGKEWRARGLVISGVGLTG